MPTDPADRLTDDVVATTVAARMSAIMRPTVASVEAHALIGPRLHLARALFGGLTLAALGLFARALPLLHAETIATVDPASQALFERAGLGVGHLAALRVGLVGLDALAFTAAGLVIVARKPRDWLALCVAYALIGQGVNAFLPLKLLFREPDYALAARVVVASILWALPLACYLFPDGRLFRRWMAPLLGLWGAWLLASALGLAGPADLFDLFWSRRVLYLLPVMGMLASGVVAQFLRYRHVATQGQRTQTKWLIYGVAVAVVAGVGANLFEALFAAFDPSPTAALAASVAAQTLSALAQLSVPIAAVFSMLRYRLYDIEVVINRSLLYGLLTLVLALTFAGVVFALQAVIRLTTGGEQAPVLAIAAATAAVTALFGPTRAFLRRTIDRKVYGIEIDYSEAARRGGAPRAEAPRGDTLTSLGAYAGLEVIGRGGMGVVYRAMHPQLQRPVAIKALPAELRDEGGHCRRFVREAQTMARLRHPNIVAIHDFGDEGSPFIVMDYVDGETLAARLRARGRLGLDEALPLLRDLAAALDHAHAQGVVHRDVKPSNVMVERADASGRERAVLMDFGVAHLASSLTQLTATGGVVGTLDYVSPEQVQGTRELDGRSDVYSLGVLAFEVLTGRRPFVHQHAAAMVMAHLLTPPPDPRTLVDLPPRSAEAILRALAKDPAERFARAGEFVAALAG